MCGRFSVTKTDGLAKRFKVKAVKVKPMYNAAPSQQTPVVLNDAPDEIQLLKWGLIPHWAKDPKIGYRMINARAETVAEKPSFKGPLKYHRCLVLADGFYEWKKEVKGKVPYRITLKSGEPFAFAGLWDEWTDPKDQTPVRTYTIITTSANAMMQPIHERMPVILKEEDEALWLDDATSQNDVLACMKPYADEQMKAYAVSTMVNSPSMDVPEVIVGV